MQGAQTLALGSFPFFVSLKRDEIMKIRKIDLLKLFKTCVIFMLMHFGNQIIFYSLNYSQEQTF